MVAPVHCDPAPA